MTRRDVHFVSVVPALLTLAPTAEPLVPDTLRLLDDPQQTSEVAVYAKPVEVPLDAPGECCVRFLHPAVPVAAHPSSTDPTTRRRRAPRVLQSIPHRPLWERAQ